MQDNTTYLIVIGAVVIGLASLAALVSYVISIVRGFQEMRHASNPPRNPPLPEELAKSYATKEELAGEIAELKQELRDERSRVEGIFNQQFNSIRSLTAKISEWQLGIERLIGKIEGKVESKWTSSN